MDIHNIHVVRRSQEMLKDALLDEGSWLRNLEASGWLNHIRSILLAASRVVQYCAQQNTSVLIHCSDGWDRTSQLTSLSMLLMDPYYRTLNGFIVLIEKEWVSFGHRFADRQGWANDGRQSDDGQGRTDDGQSNDGQGWAYDGQSYDGRHGWPSDGRQRPHDGWTTDS